MTTTGGKNKTRGQLWLARKRLGLRQKHVAYLLKHQTTDQVSRYEKGRRIPGLKILLQFEIIYGLPLRILYAEEYAELKAEIKERAESLKTINPAYISISPEAGLFSAFCSHEEMLRNPHLSQTERDQIHRHILNMMNRYHQL